MPQLILILVVFAALYFGVKWAGKASKAQIRGVWRMAAGVALMLVGVLLCLRGVLDIGLPLLLGGFALLQAGPIARVSDGLFGPIRKSLEIYLDRRFAGWRQHMDADPAAGMRRPPDSRAVSEQEAYEVLGLQPGASKAEIIAAHRRLIVAVHPDKGGSTFLASRINQARDRLLNKHS